MMRVLVVIALPTGQEVIPLVLEEGTTLGRALDAARLGERYPRLTLVLAGVWGRRREPDYILRAGDRVEVYRELRADAKAMRRARAGLRTSTRSRSGP